MASASVSLMSCSDDKDDDNTKEEAVCNDTTVLTCASNTAKTKCDGGKIVSENCGPNETCQDNICKSGDATIPCDSTTVLACASATVKTKCEDNIIKAENCNENETCLENVCVPNERDNLVGDTCTTDVCYKNIPHYCDKGNGKLYINTVSESPACEDGKVCEVADGINAFCLESCTKENDKKFVCGQNQVQLYSAEAVCKKFDDGKLALYVDESDVDNTEFCEVDCIDGHCTDVKPTTADKGKPCDKSKYGMHCDNDSIVFCNSFGLVDVSSCDGRLCKVDAANKNNVACVTNEPCDEGDVSYFCTTNEDTYVDRQSIYTCTKATDNKYYLFGDGRNCKAETCTESGGCEPED